MLLFLEKPSNGKVNQEQQEKTTRELLERFGNNVRKLRKEKEWTQETLAESASINDKEVSHIEQGNRNVTLETLVKISIALDIDPHLLLN